MKNIIFKKNITKILLGIFILTMIKENTIASNKTNTSDQSTQSTDMDIELIKKNLTNAPKYNNKCSGIIIIGSGPAGLTAGLYAARLGIKNPIIFGGPLPGGFLTTTGVVENWPGSLSIQGQDIIDSQMKQATEAGAQIIHETIVDIDASTWPFKITTDRNTYYGFTVVIASGSKIKKLGCPGEDTFWGKGVSSCALCDALAHKNKTVVVIGGGDSACEETLQLLPHVNHIYICVRKDHMRASLAMQNKIKNNPKVTILYNTEVKKIIGNNDEIKDAMITINGKELLLSDINTHAPLSGIFLAIGHIPNTEFIKGIKLDENKLIIVKNQKTSKEGIFAAGDVCNLYRQACVASSEGCIAAIEAFNFLEKYSISELYHNTKYDNIWIGNNNSCQDGLCKIPQCPITQNSIEETEKINSEPIQTSSSDSKENDNTVHSITNINDFRSLAKKHKDELYLIQIAASYCPPCKTMKKTLKEYKETYKKTIPVYVAYIEDIPSLAKEFNLKGFPTLLLFKGKKLITKKMGSMPLHQFKKWIDSEK